MHRLVEICLGIIGVCSQRRLIADGYAGQSAADWISVGIGDTRRRRRKICRLARRCDYSNGRKSAVSRWWCSLRRNASSQCWRRHFVNGPERSIL